MINKTLVNLTEQDLTNVCGGQPLYGVFDNTQKKIKYYIPREKDVLMTYNATAVKEMCGDRQIQHCETCEEAECYSWSIANNFHLFSKK